MRSCLIKLCDKLGVSFVLLPKQIELLLFVAERKRPIKKNRRRTLPLRTQKVEKFFNLSSTYNNFVLSLIWVVKNFLGWRRIAHSPSVSISRRSYFSSMTLSHQDFNQINHKSNRIANNTLTRPSPRNLSTSLCNKTGWEHAIKGSEQAAFPRNHEEGLKRT